MCDTPNADKLRESIYWYISWLLKYGKVDDKFMVCACKLEPIKQNPLLFFVNPIKSYMNPKLLCASVSEQNTVMHGSKTMYVLQYISIQPII